MKQVVKFLALASCVLHVEPFAAVQSSLKTGSVRLHAETLKHAVEIVDGEDRVLDVASFRNGLVNPEMMVERAQAKRDAIDTTAAAVDGLKIGFLIVGPVAAAASYFNSGDIGTAAYSYGEYFPRENFRHQYMLN